MNRGEIFRVMLDAKRRPTLPQALLDAAGVGAGENMVAHLAGPGRIVLEAPASVLARLQEAVRAGVQQRSAAAAPLEDLLGGELAAEEPAGEISVETGDGGSGPTGAPEADGRAR